MNLNCEEKQKNKNKSLDMEKLYGRMTTLSHINRLRTFSWNVLFHTPYSLDAIIKSVKL